MALFKMNDPFQNVINIISPSKLKKQIHIFLLLIYQIAKSQFSRNKIKTTSTIKSPKITCTKRKSTYKNVCIYIGIHVSKRKCSCLKQFIQL